MSFFVLVKIVYKSVGMGDSAAPRLAIAQRFGLPDALGQSVAGNVFDEAVYLSDRCLIGFLLF